PPSTITPSTRATCSPGAIPRDVPARHDAFVTLDLVAHAANFVDLTGLLSTGEVDGFTVGYLSWGFFTPQVWRNHLHTHSFHEICLAYSGSGTFTVDGADHRVETGTVFVARPGEVHEIISDPVEGLGIAFWGIALQPVGASPATPPGWWDGCCARTGPASRRRWAPCRP